MKFFVKTNGKIPDKVSFQSRSSWILNTYIVPMISPHWSQNQLQIESKVSRETNNENLKITTYYNVYIYISNHIIWKVIINLQILKRSSRFECELMVSSAPKTPSLLSWYSNIFRPIMLYTCILTLVSWKMMTRTDKNKRKCSL